MKDYANMAGIVLSYVEFNDIYFMFGQSHNININEFPLTIR